MSERPLVLIVCDYYLPGFQSGGGMRTIVNMVERLGERFDFRIITRDHDGKQDRTPYTTVKIDEWNRVGNAQVYYLSKDNVKISKLHELIESIKPRIIYFNSFFATPAIYVLLLKRLGRIGNIPLILAPCGELSDGALQLKGGKKKIFMMLSKAIGLYRDLIWKASSDLEEKEIEHYKGKGGKIMIAPDLPPRTMFENFRPSAKGEKSKGRAKMIFLSRFVRKKNFKWLLPILETVRGNLEIDVWGPLEDEGYWSECVGEMRNLPDGIKIEAKGIVPHENIYDVLVKYDFFILPTLGENFGHVFLEALAAGCPLLISDRTPWRGLAERQIGWDLPLEEPDRWRDAIARCIDLDAAEYRVLSGKSRAYLEQWLADKKIEESTLSVLTEACGNTLTAAGQIGD